MLLAQRDIQLHQEWLEHNLLWSCVRQNLPIKGVIGMISFSSYDNRHLLFLSLLLPQNSAQDWGIGSICGMNEWRRETDWERERKNGTEVERRKGREIERKIISCLCILHICLSSMHPAIILIYPSSIYISIPLSSHLSIHSSIHPSSIYPSTIQLCIRPFIISNHHLSIWSQCWPSGDVHV